MIALPTRRQKFHSTREGNLEQSHYHGTDINTIHNVTHTYHPAITEIIPQTNYSSQYKEDTGSFHQFSLHQVYMTNSDTPTKTHSLYNVQPTSHTS